MKKHLFSSQAGFTLIELLVVISIISVLAGLLLTNFVGVRGRAADSKRKNDVNQLKTALRLYYNDFAHYPLGSNGALMGCGSAGTSACSAGGEFSAGAGGTIYMKELPAEFAYYGPTPGGDEFILITELENASDTEIAASQNKCDPESKSYVGVAVSELDFVVCED